MDENDLKEEKDSMINSEDTDENSEPKLITSKKQLWDLIESDDESFASACDSRSEHSSKTIDLKNDDLKNDELLKTVDVKSDSPKTDDLKTDDSKTNDSKTNPDKKPNKKTKTPKKYLPKSEYCGPYKCPTCSTEFTYKTQLDRHRANKSDCSITISDYEIHVKTCSKCNNEQLTDYLSTIENKLEVCDFLTVHKRICEDVYMGVNDDSNEKKCSEMSNEQFLKSLSLPKSCATDGVNFFTPKTMVVAEKDIFRCPGCNNKFDSAPDFQNHIVDFTKRCDLILKNELESGFCSFCREEIVDVDQFLKHINQNCGIILAQGLDDSNADEASDDESLSGHIEHQSEPSGYACTACGFVVVDLKELKYHNWLSHDDAIITTPNFIEIKDEKVVEARLAVQTKVSGYSCEDCGFVTKSKTALSHHMFELHGHWSTANCEKIYHKEYVEAKLLTQRKRSMSGKFSEEPLEKLKKEEEKVKEVVVLPGIDAEESIKFRDLLKISDAVLPNSEKAESTSKNQIIELKSDEEESVKCMPLMAINEDTSDDEDKPAPMGSITQLLESTFKNIQQLHPSENVNTQKPNSAHIHSSQILGSNSGRDSPNFSTIGRDPSNSNSTSFNLANFNTANTNSASLNSQNLNSPAINQIDSNTRGSRWTFLDNGKVKCNLCNHVGASLGGLKSHISRNHPPDQAYTCDICYKFYRTASSMSAHLQTVHNLGESDCFKNFTKISGSEIIGHMIRTNEVVNIPQRKARMKELINMFRSGEPIPTNFYTHEKPRVFNAQQEQDERICKQQQENDQLKMFEKTLETGDKQTDLNSALENILNKYTPDQSSLNSPAIPENTNNFSSDYPDFSNLSNLNYSNLNLPSNLLSNMLDPKLPLIEPPERQRMRSNRAKYTQLSDRSFQCNICNHVSQTYAGCISHLRRSHPPNLAYACKLCHKVSKSEQNIISHLADHKNSSDEMVEYSKVVFKIYGESNVRRALLTHEQFSHGSLDKTKLVDLLKELQDPDKNNAEMQDVKMPNYVSNNGNAGQKSPRINFNGGNNPNFQDSADLSMDSANFNSSDFNSASFSANFDQHDLTNPDTITNKALMSQLSDVNILKSVNGRLRRYIQLPNGSFQCIICQKIATSQMNINSHISMKHPVGSAYSCSYCFKFYKSESRFFTHLAGAHEIKNPILEGNCTEVQEEHVQMVNLATNRAFNGQDFTELKKIISDLKNKRDVEWVNLIERPGGNSRGYQQPRSASQLLADLARMGGDSDDGNVLEIEDLDEMDDEDDAPTVLPVGKTRSIDTNLDDENTDTDPEVTKIMENPDIPPEVKRIMQLAATSRTIYAFECNQCEFIANTDEEVQYHYDDNHPGHADPPIVKQIYNEETAKLKIKNFKNSIIISNPEPKHEVSLNTNSDQKPDQKPDQNSDQNTPDLIKKRTPIKTMTVKNKRQAAVDAEVFKQIGIMGYQCGYCNALMGTSGAIESHHQKHHKREAEMLVYHMFDAREIQRLIRTQHYDKEVEKLQLQGLVDQNMVEVIPGKVIAHRCGLCSKPVISEKGMWGHLKKIHQRRYGSTEFERVHTLEAFKDLCMLTPAPYEGQRFPDLDQKILKQQRLTDKIVNSGKFEHVEETPVEIETPLVEFRTPKTIKLEKQKTEEILKPLDPLIQTNVFQNKPKPSVLDQLEHLISRNTSTSSSNLQTMQEMPFHNNSINQNPYNKTVYGYQCRLCEYTTKVKKTLSGHCNKEHGFWSTKGCIEITDEKLYTEKLKISVIKFPKSMPKSNALEEYGGISGYIREDSKKEEAGPSAHRTRTVTGSLPEKRPDDKSEPVGYAPCGKTPLNNVKCLSCSLFQTPSK